MQAYLLSNQTNRVVASQRFQAVVAAPGNNPYSGVLAAHQATKIICRKIAKFVVISTQSAEKNIKKTRVNDYFLILMSRGYYA